MDKILSKNNETMKKREISTGLWSGFIISIVYLGLAFFSGYKFPLPLTITKDGVVSVVSLAGNIILIICLGGLSGILIGFTIKKYK